jgi:hypothetical protein
MTLVKVENDNADYWLYCCKSFGSNECWNKLIPLVGLSATYRFSNPEDAVAFKIRFGI